MDSCIPTSQWTGAPSHHFSHPEYSPWQRPIPFRMPIFLQHKVLCELIPYASVETAETVCDEWKWLTKKRVCMHLTSWGECFNTIFSPNRKTYPLVYRYCIIGKLLSGVRQHWTWAVFILPYHVFRPGAPTVGLSRRLQLRYQYNRMGVPRDHFFRGSRSIIYALCNLKKIQDRRLTDSSCFGTSVGWRNGSPAERRPRFFALGLRFLYLLRQSMALAGMWAPWMRGSCKKFSRSIDITLPIRFRD